MASSEEFQDASTDYGPLSQRQAENVADLAADALKEAVSTGISSGIKAITSDQEFVERFWKAGYDSLVKHAANGTSQWIGKRILTTLVLAIITAGIVWLVKTGAIK